MKEVFLNFWDNFLKWQLLTVKDLVQGFNLLLLLDLFLLNADLLKLVEHTNLYFWNPVRLLSNRVMKKDFNQKNNMLQRDDNYEEWDNLSFKVPITHGLLNTT